jgi:hypothetical protein
MPGLRRPPWWHPFVRGGRAVVAFVTHAGIAVVLIALMYVVEDALDITKQGKRMLLDVLPMRYLFDLIDAGLIVLFGGWRLIDVYNELRTPVCGKDAENRG